jgi:hypothetical protein
MAREIRVIFRVGFRQVMGGRVLDFMSGGHGVGRSIFDGCGGDQKGRLRATVAGGADGGALLLI